MVVHEVGDRSSAVEITSTRGSAGDRRVESLLDAAGVLRPLRRLARSAAADLGVPWTVALHLGTVVNGVPAGVCERLVAAVADGVVRVEGARFSADPPHGPSRWYPLFSRSVGGPPRLSVRRSMQIVEFARLARSLHGRGWRVDAASGPFDIVASDATTRWAITIVEDALLVDELSLTVQRHGIAIDFERPTSADHPLETARSLHLGRFSHFSVVAPGLRRDHSLRHGQDCVILEPDLTPC